MAENKWHLSWRFDEKVSNIYGYPNWWYGCPMALFSFFDENDLSGKQVYLFCSHGTGGLAGSVKDISAANIQSHAQEHNLAVVMPSGKP